VEDKQLEERNHIGRLSWARILLGEVQGQNVEGVKGRSANALKTGVRCRGARRGENLGAVAKTGQGTR